MMSFRRLICSALLAFAVAAPASAQDYPSRPVRIVVPVPPGGGLDVVARVLARRLGEDWKQPVVVENRPGAGGGIGAAMVAQAAPDGLTLLAAQDQVMVANRFLYKSLPYDPDKQFAPVAMLVQADQLVLAAGTVAADDLRALVASSRRGERLSYGSYGSGSTPQLAFETLNKHEKLSLLHVPYKGIAPVIQALLAGEVQLSVGSSAVAAGQIRAGKLKPLAVASTERDATFPDVKTTAELGFPYLQMSIWHSLYAPAGTPPEITRKIAADVDRILAEPEVRKQIAGFRVLGGTPQALAARLREEVARAAEMIANAGIQPE